MKLFLSSLTAILLAWTPGVFAAGNAGPPKPNFLILHTDDQRADTLGCYNPDTYTYDPYGPRPQSGAPEIDWVKFQKAHPADYARIKSAIEALNVTWEQATGDPAIREKVSAAARYWY